MRIRNCDLCTFCRGTTEIVNHLFWNCRKVSEFLNSIKDEADRIAPGFDIGFTQNNLYGKEVFILGDNRAYTGLEVNYLYNIAKKYIWNTRCKRLERRRPFGPQQRCCLRRGSSTTWTTASEETWCSHSGLRFITTLAARRGIG